MADIIIVGAGVAGAALAYALGKDGRRVHVIERDLGLQDRIVGEVLQPGGCLKLEELGLQDCLEEIDAQPILGYRFYKNGKGKTMPYPVESYPSGKGFHNGLFVQRLRERAASLPNVTMQQGTVTSLIEEKGTIKGVNYKTEGQDSIAYAPLTIVCDGAFSNLRRSFCDSEIDVWSHFVALALENNNFPDPEFMHAIFEEPAFFFYPIGSNEIRCFVDVPIKPLPSNSTGEMANYLKTVLAPQMVPFGLHDAFIAAVDRGNIRSMPNRVMPASIRPTPGALILGDALNMRHALTGSGMTAALNDIVIVRNLLRPLKNLESTPPLWEYLSSFYTVRKQMASTINSVSLVLYKALANPEPDRKEMSQAFFNYCTMGGFPTRGMVSLASALDTRPSTLLLHLVLIAAYCISWSLYPFPSPKRIYSALGMLAGAYNLVFLLIKGEKLGWIFSQASSLPKVPLE